MYAECIYRYKSRTQDYHGLHCSIPRSGSVRMGCRLQVDCRKRPQQREVMTSHVEWQGLVLTFRSASNKLRTCDRTIDTTTSMIEEKILFKCPNASCMLRFNPSQQAGLEGAHKITKLTSETVLTAVSVHFSSHALPDHRTTQLLI
jgi:hypothetical protein